MSAPLCGCALEREVARVNAPDAAVAEWGTPRVARVAAWSALTMAGIVGVWYLSRWNYLLFHVAAETFSIATAMIILIFALAARRMATNGFLAVLGAGMAPMAAILLLHAMAYKGMAVLVPPLAAGDANPTTQLWLASRYLLAATMVTAPFFLGRRVNIWIGIITASAVGALLVSAILWWRVFPIAFVAGAGLTPFKIWSEYGVIAALGLAAVLLIRWRDRTDHTVVTLTLCSIGAFITAELLFTLYTDVFGVLNVLAHLAQLTGFILLLLGIVRTVVSRPMALVFSELSASEARLARANRSLAMLSECRGAIANADSQQELLTGVCRVAVETGGYRLAWIGEAMHDSDSTVRVTAAWGDACGYLDGLQVTWSDDDTGRGPIGTAIRTGEPFVCRDVTTDPRFAPWREKALEYGLYSDAALPIDAGTRRYGTLTLYAGEIGRFDDEEIALILQLAASIGNGLEALRLRSDRERSFAELREQRERLEDVVGERTAELTAAIADLEQASNAKNRFLRNMSHELRTPLNSIIGFSQVMLQGLAGPLAEEQATQLRMVNASGRHLLHLVSQMLDLSGIEARASEVVLSEFEVGELVESVAGPMRVLARQNHLEFRTELPEAPIMIVSDEAKLRRILLSLVGNAVKFTKAGSVHVAVDDSHCGEVRFVVSDTGCGIPPEELGRVMEEFHQVEQPDGMRPEGAGLGLTIAARLAGMLGGRISATSVLDRGSVFTLVLPLGESGIRNLDTV